MGNDGDEIARLAGALRACVGILTRRLRQVYIAGDVTLPEASALARLDRHGPSTPSVLATLEQISPQSMGATLTGLEARGFITRAADPEDGRRVVFEIAEPGREALLGQRRERTELVAQALTNHFTVAERKRLAEVTPLLERLADVI